MDLFKRKIAPAIDQPDPDEFKDVTESLYKRNLELAVKNKTLSLLRQLYQISILVLEPEVLAQKIVELVRETLEFEMVGILVLESGDLVPLKFSRSERLTEALSKTTVPFEPHTIKAPEDIPFFDPLFKNSSNHTHSLKDLWGTIPDDVLIAAQDQAHIKTVLAYPLTIDNKLSGILLLCFNRSYDELNQYEQESLISIADVTAISLDRARIYAELKRVNSELEQANKQQVVLIHFITHQIKGFLTKSRNIFSMMKEGDLGTMPDTAKTWIDAGFDSDTKGVRTVQEILSAANIKSGKVTYTLVPFNLKALVEEIVDDLTPLAEAKKLTLHLELPDAPLMYTGDRTQLLNALKNLVDNSIKYTPSGSVSITLKQTSGKILFEIQDTGVGITTEDMENLFTEGGHGKDSQKVNVESTGFGLYIVKNIIEAHRGTVRAESEGADKGSHFIVELPVTA